MTVSPGKSGPPVSISWTTTPKAQMSLRLSTALPRACSGLIYAAVPSSVPTPVARAGEVMVGEIVAFRVLLPDDDWLYLEGEVRHHHHGLGFGVQFVDLNEEQSDKLLVLLQIAREAGPEAPAITADLVED